MSGSAKARRHERAVRMLAVRWSPPNSRALTKDGQLPKYEVEKARRRRQAAR